MRYADVIVPLAVDGVYTYTVPDCLENTVREGMLVLVAFAGNKKYTAVVARLHDRKPEGYEVKALDSIAEEQVCISDLHLKFLLWISEYYMAMPGEVIKAALPVAFRLESFTSITRTTKEIDYTTLTVNGKAFLAFLHPGEYVALKEVEKYLRIKNGLPLVKSLLADGYIQVKETVDDFFREKIVRIVKWGTVYMEDELVKVIDNLKRASGQQIMLCRWIEQRVEEMERTAFLKLTGGSAAMLKGLCEKGILKVEEREMSRLGDDLLVEAKSHILTDAQQVALEKIQESFQEKDCVLLRGVTSSGKTEVYIHLIQEYMAKGVQVLYMLPEIALTIQIVRRLERVFGGRIGIYHSGMSDNMRAELWKKQCSDNPYQLILGVRSSVFLPFTRLGLIIIDEEHDASYKQKEPAPRYNGRDAAIMLAKMYGGKVLLGSATPSFESFQHTVANKYGLVELSSRYGGIQMPELVLADLSEYRRKKLMRGSFSPLLIEEMKKTLDEQKQVILFQNRRGYSSYVQCDRCGSIPKCRHCDVSLTYYKQRNVLICRYCGTIVGMSDLCPDCGEGHYQVRTPGTERIEEDVKKLFPESRVARMDLDVMGSKSRFRTVIDDFERGETDILIGTQMVTKGLDFENVKLVGVIDADSMISFPDFRAEERAWSMLMQVSGRSGRRGERGKVVVQTGDIKNRIYQMLIDGSYLSFFEQLSPERRLFGYPPFGRIIQVELRHKEVIALRNSANYLAGKLREKLGKRVCGPAVPEISKIGGYYRLIFVVKIEAGISFSSVKYFLKSEFCAFRGHKEFGSVRIICDVDY